ncbi:putative beta-lactamase class A [Caenibius tardaugens NBRC 16725]|uniref:beta-lactamase n=1 Tax=Caenibius tardaugens NBRC 16725 TaxID=1219035 RepID=U2Y7P4_9SPHN|nr:class A beta-lactamase [Caenibius tardaugens]GAD49226.1 putative beta-lactamase class A [Caenibius tardaugens NBRC 16725]
MIDITRRNALMGTAALVLSGCVGRTAHAADLHERLGAIERAAGGTLGAYVLDTASGEGTGWRQDERFAQCSSFKLSLAALALHLQEAGEITLNERIAFTKADLLQHSPVTSQNLDTGMTIGELAQATMVTSDNAAANLLLHRFGGPERLTAFWRALGDDTSRLDRYEPELNDVPPGEIRDTTTPVAAAHTLARLLTDNALREPSRDTLIRWMIAVETGGKRLRAGLPAGWRAGDKTGTGIGQTNATYVDIGWFELPSGQMVVVTSYFRPGKITGTIDPGAEFALAEVGRVAADWAMEQRS